MGVLDVTLSELIAQMDGSYSLYGENFTKSSKVYVNGEKQKTTFLNNTRIDILDTEIKEGDTIEVSQVGSSNRIFRTSKQYIYQGGKLVEAPDTTVDQTEGTTTENTEQQIENTQENDGEISGLQRSDCVYFRDTEIYKEKQFGTHKRFFEDSW